MFIQDVNRQVPVHHLVPTERQVWVRIRESLLGASRFAAPVWLVLQLNIVVVDLYRVVVGRLPSLELFFFDFAKEQGLVLLWVTAFV